MNDQPKSDEPQSEKPAPEKPAAKSDPAKSEKAKVDKSKSGKSAAPGRSGGREKSRQAQAAALAADKRRETRFRIIGGLVAVLVVAGIIAVPVLTKKSSTPAASASSNPNAVLPTGVSAPTYGVPFGTAAETRPLLEIWEDFQCPGCGDLERTRGADIAKLAEDGKVRLLWRPANFLDDKFPQSNQSSRRATAAWGCAIDAGKSAEYHSTVFANQPTVEGTGFTDSQLLEFGKTAGISGDAYNTFESCVTAKKYQDWAINSAAIFVSDGVPGTPAAYLTSSGGDRKEIPADQLRDPARVAALIAAATG